MGERVREEEEEEEDCKRRMREATALQRDAALTRSTKRNGDTLKYVLPRMPSENAELPAYFDMVDMVTDCR